MTTIVNIEVDQGAHRTIEFIYDDFSTGLPIDLTGYTAKMQVRSVVGDSVILLEFSTTNGKINLSGSDGIVKVFISPTDTTVGLGDPPWSRGLYDLFLTKTSDGTVTRLVKGLFFILPRATQ